MVLIDYLRIFVRWWWIIVLASVPTIATTFYLVNQQPDVFASEGTMVIRPRAVDQEDALRAVGTLIRGAEINSTYAAIARSDVIRQRAAARLDDPRMRDLDMTTEIVTGTNILRIGVTGPDPALAHELATIMMDEVATYVQESGDAYLLTPLDLPDLSDDPVAPDRRLTIALGVVLGLSLGMGLALFAEKLHRGHGPMRPWNRSGIADEEALRRTVHDQIDRLALPRQRVAFATLTLSHEEPSAHQRDRTARIVADGLLAHLRNSIEVGVLDDGTIVAVVPEPGVDGLQREIVAVRDAVAPTLVNRVSGSVRMVSSVCICTQQDRRGDPNAMEVFQHLAKPHDLPRARVQYLAGTSTNGRGT